MRLRCLRPAFLFHGHGGGCRWRRNWVAPRAGRAAKSGQELTFEPSLHHHTSAMFDSGKTGSAQKEQARAVLPSYVTDKLVVLSKASLRVRDTYEIRLALFMAASKGLQFVLAVRSGAIVDHSVLELLAEHGGTVQEADLPEFSVYLGRAKLDGSEDGWVLGDSSALKSLTCEVKSEGLRARLAVGAVWAHEELDELAAKLTAEHIALDNIDGENVVAALLALVHAARSDGGHLFIQ